MTTQIKSERSPNGANHSHADQFNPDEIRRIVELGKQRGLISTRGVRPTTEVAEPIEKNGHDVSEFNGVRSQWMEITPEKAELWLKNNFRNRPVRHDVIAAYARDMINGAWVATHQGLAFNDRDELIDGQHRLKAVILSGKTVRMMVTFGLPSKIEGKEMTTMDAVDRGATRTVADQLTIQHGFSNSSLTVAICGAIANICYGERTRRLTVTQTLEVFRQYEKAVEYVIEHRAKERGLRVGGVLAGFAFALSTEENFWEAKTPISEMFKQVMTGTGIVDGTPAKLLRDFLLSDEAKLFTKSLDRGLAELTLQAIWLQVTGKRSESLELLLDGANYFRTLQAERAEKIKAIFVLPKPVTTAVAAPAAEAPAPVEKTKPTLDAIFTKATASFGVAKMIIVGKGEDADINFIRAAIANCALRLGYSAPEVTKVLRHNAKHYADWLPKLKNNQLTTYTAELGRFEKALGLEK